MDIVSNFIKLKDIYTKFPDATVINAMSTNFVEKRNNSYLNGQPYHGFDMFQSTRKPVYEATIVIDRYDFKSFLNEPSYKSLVVHINSNIYNSDELYIGMNNFHINKICNDSESNNFTIEGIADEIYIKSY